MMPEATSLTLGQHVVPYLWEPATKRSGSMSSEQSTSGIHSPMVKVSSNAKWLEASGVHRSLARHYEVAKPRSSLSTSSRTGTRRCSLSRQKGGSDATQAPGRKDPAARDSEARVIVWTRSAEWTLRPKLSVSVAPMGKTRDTLSRGPPPCGANHSVFLLSTGKRTSSSIPPKSSPVASASWAAQIKAGKFCTSRYNDLSESSDMSRIGSYMNALR